MKLQTPSRTVVSISTQWISDKEIINYRCIDAEGSFTATELNFDYSLLTEKIEAILDSLAERYAKALPRKPSYEMTKLTKSDRNYLFYIYFEDHEDLFKFQPKIIREIAEAVEKAKNANQA